MTPPFPPSNSPRSGREPPPRPRPLTPVAVRAQPAFDILLIDDEDTIRAALGEALTRAGYTWRGATHGRNALTELERHCFRLIITDVYMPEMDGLELLMHCAKTYPHVPVLTISGGCSFSNADTTLLPAKYLGAQHTLAKPFGIRDLVAAVAQLIGPALPPPG